MISAIFRRGGDVAFVVEELKAVFDPQGGQWMGGRYVPSLLAAIGGVIETHMIRTGFLAPPRQPGEEEGAGRPRPWPPASVPQGPRRRAAAARSVHAAVHSRCARRRAAWFATTADIPSVTDTCVPPPLEFAAQHARPRDNGLLAECLENTHVPSHFGSKSLLPSSG